MTNNFIEIIGFQEEKVHTGILAWLLNSENPEIPISAQAEFLGKLFGSDFPVESVIRISPKREFPFGRKGRIDLVVEAETSEGEKWFLVIECKTDSDVNLKQLVKSKNNFIDEHSKEQKHSTFIVLTIGASQFTYQYQLKDIHELNWEVYDIKKLINLLTTSSLIIKNNIIKKWVDALKNEIMRTNDLLNNLIEMEHPWDTKLISLGYRTGFPIFYMYYDKLRYKLSPENPYEWDIYSGSNNPVMNLKSKRYKAVLEGKEVPLFWEYNWSTFRLKAGLGKQYFKNWNQFRERIINVCKQCPILGKKSPNRKGEYVSIFKWEFNFCKQEINYIASQTNQILKFLDNKIQNVV